MDHNIYEKLFEIANQNMQQSGNSFVHPKAAFLAYAQMDPHAADILSLMKVSATNPEFLEIAYVALLNRPIDEEAYQSWKKKFYLPETKFRAVVIQRLTGSQEADIRHKRIYNNIFVQRKRKYQKNDSLNVVVQKLLPVYRRLPEGIKAPIRKVMGVK